MAYVCTVCEHMGVTSRSDVSPSCDPGCSSGGKSAAMFGQAHGSDVVGKGDGGIQEQQGDVIVVGFCIIFGVTDDVFNTSGDLIGIQALLSLFPQIHNQVLGIREAEEKNTDSLPLTCC